MQGICEGPAAIGPGLSGCPAGTICNSGELNTSGVSEGTCVAPQYVANNSAGTVSDTVTGLVWEQTPIAGYSDAPVTGPPESYCQTGWRLPTLPELFSLVDVGHTPPWLDPEVFPTTSANFYFTSSMQPCCGRLLLDFDNGGVYLSGDPPAGVVEGLNIRCVR